MSNTYERISGKDANGKRFSYILRDPVWCSTLVVGDEVDIEGALVERNGALQYHVMSVELVTKRTPLAMDNHYGLLVPVVDSV